MPIRKLTAQLVFLALAVGMVGCGPKQPDFPELVPVKGTVKKGKDTVTGGVLQFSPETALTAFIVTGPVGTDGTYSLTTTRTTDKTGESRSGAPAGKYKVVYLPQPGEPPVELAAPVDVKAGEDIPIDLAKSVTHQPKIDSKKGSDTKTGFSPGKASDFGKKK